MGARPRSPTRRYETPAPAAYNIDAAANALRQRPGATAIITGRPKSPKVEATPGPAPLPVHLATAAPSRGFSISGRPATPKVSGLEAECRC